MRFYLSLGANLGSRRASLETVLRALPEAGVPLDRISPLYETEPWQAPEGSPWFLNLVASGPVGPGTPPPRTLLERILEVEIRSGRTRDVRAGPRELDVDLLLYHAAVIDEPGLTVPHPHMHRRRFVLVPLNDLAPDLVHPVLGRTTAELLASLPPGGEVRPALWGPEAGAMIRGPRGRSGRASKAHSPS